MGINDRALIYEKNRIISYKKGALYIRHGEDQKPIKLCKLPNTGIKALLAKITLTERLLRLEPRFAYPCTDDKFYLSYNGKLYMVDQTTGALKELFAYREKMHNPLNVCLARGLSGFENGLYFGEYWGNTDKQEVSIFVANEETCKKIFTFPAGAVTHIHGVVADYERGRMLILTGDSDSESGIWMARDNFSVVERLCGGSQQYRSCCAYFCEGGIYYATDTPLEQNYIYKYSEDTRSVSVFKKISGPCIYSMDFVGKDGKKYYAFATSVEPDSRFVGGWKYRLSRKPGPGVSDNCSHLYITDFSAVFYEIEPFQKDWLPYQLFQFGNIRFPYQNVEGILAICPQSIKKYHGKTLRLINGEIV